MKPDPAEKLDRDAAELEEQQNTQIWHIGTRWSLFVLLTIILTVTILLTATAGLRAPSGEVPWLLRSLGIFSSDHLG